MSSADRWIRWYYETREDTGAPALDMIDSRGRVYAKDCSECSFQHRHWSNELKAWVCGHCGHAWEYRDVVMFKGEVSTPRRAGSTEHRLAKRVDVGTQFSEFTTDPKYRWEARLYVANCLGWSLRELLEKGRETWGEGFHWSYRQVREAVWRGRLEWARRMKLVGLIG